MTKDKFVYDAEELELLEEIENGEWTDKPLTKKESDKYAQRIIRKYHFGCLGFCISLPDSPD